MTDIDKVIFKLFASRWCGELCNAPVEVMKKQLHKSLQDQVNGFWSGHTAYHIMVDGGFLIDSKRINIPKTNKAEGKKLTEFGKIFMDSMKIN